MEALFLDLSQFDAEIARTGQIIDYPVADGNFLASDGSVGNTFQGSFPSGNFESSGGDFHIESTGAMAMAPGEQINGGFGAMEDHHWHAGMEDGVFLEPAPMESSDEADPLKDPVLSYISDMLMDEDTDEYAGYQSMANELTQIISESSSSGSDRTEPTNKVDTWIDGVFNHEEVVDSGLSVEARTFSDQEYEETMHKMMNQIEISSEWTASTSASTSAPTSAPAPASVSNMNIAKVGEEEKVAAEEGNAERDTLCLQSLLHECSQFLKDSDKDAEDHDPWAGDLLVPQDQLAAGHVRTAAVPDSDAIESEKALKQELHAQLIECAQVVAADDMTKAYEIANRIRDKVSPHGSGTQRLVFYFADALVARITGTGALLYSALCKNKPTVQEMLKAYRLVTKYSPNVRISHYVCNQTILDATVGASRVHIIDYGVLYGLMWPCLIKAYSAREGGPPHLRITGVDFPQPGFKPSERIEETGRRLAEYAKQVGVPFEFHAIATTKWESVQASTLLLRHDEVLIVSSHFRLRHLLDESVMVDSPRKLVLARIRSMKPKVFLQAVVNGNYNAPFFISRFREALGLYSAFFDVIDTAIPEHPERMFIEQGIVGREILNIVACEGQERVERAETYRQWQSRTSRAGFEQLPLRPEIYAKARAMLGTYHKNFGIGQDGNWLLIGWKDSVLHAVCSWTPR